MEGRLHVAHTDGTEGEAGPDDAYVIEPGHDAWVVGDEPVVAFEFESAETYARLDSIPERRARLDVIMLAITGGRERTGEQFAKLLEAAGFTESTLIHTSGPLRIVEAVVS